MDYPDGPKIIPRLLKSERKRQKKVRGRYDYGRKAQRDTMLMALKRVKGSHQARNVGSV